MRSYHASRDPRIVPAPVSPEEFAVAVRASVERDTATAFVAEDAGRIVGFVSGAIEANQPDRLPERFATVGYIYVVPGERRQGIARQLIQAMKQWASGSGVNHMEMSVLAEDTEAAEFWQAVGFSPFLVRLWMPIDDGMRP